MLDTDMCIFIARNNPRQVRPRFLTFIPGEVVLSAVTHGELCCGAAKSGRSREDQQRLERVILDIPVVPLDEIAASMYGKLRADLERRGQIIGGNDLWIGAHALALGLILVTNNEREFRRIEDLTVENWVKPE